MELFALLLTIKLEIFTVLSIGHGFGIHFGDGQTTISELCGLFVSGILAFSIAFTLIIYYLSPKLYQVYVCKFVSKLD